MKKILLLLSLTSYTLVSCSQDVQAPDVPSVVMNAFQTNFSDATDIDWEKKKGFYEVDFEIGTIDHEVQISPSGKIIIHKHAIPATELPQAVQTLLSSTFKDSKLDSAEKLVKDGQVFYQIELDKRLSEKHLVYDAQGVSTNVISYWD